jgi:transcriptional regulator with XRE-family HTH domain
MGKRLTGEMIRKRRLRLGMSQPALAKAVGVSKLSIINWEKDRRKPHPIAYAKLAEVLSQSK